MAFVVGILGALQILGGMAIFVLAPSAIQEILGAVMFGMGVLAFAVGALIERTDQQIALLRSPRHPPQPTQPAPTPDLSALQPAERDRYMQAQEEAQRRRRR